MSGREVECAADLQAARTERDQRDKGHCHGARPRCAGGFTLHVIDDGHRGAAFLMTKWNLTRELPDLAAVAAFLDQAGARHA